MTQTIRNIIPIIKANWFGKNDVAVIDTISIDSRSLQNGENTLFFALTGPNHDGHLYLEELISKGVQYFVVSQIPNAVAQKANFLVVENTLDALQKFASYYRSLFESFYGGSLATVPYFWMPKWSNTDDPSARTLEVY